MIPLAGSTTAAHVEHQLFRTVWLLGDADDWVSDPERTALLGGAPPSRPADAVLIVHPSGTTCGSHRGSCVTLPRFLDYLSPGDILWIAPDGSRVNVLWRATANANSLLLTEQCDNYCLMCSQPPKDRDDSWLLERALEVVRLLPESTRELGLTGGEPTLLGDPFLVLLREIRSRLPMTESHLLTNGRRFADYSFAEAYASIDNQRLMAGIPIYGAEAGLHDYVVQAPGAFDDTVHGVLNLCRLRQRVEIRVVVHKQTAEELPAIAEFIVRNLPFVEKVALMGLEMIGFARANVDDVWIDPVEYQAPLLEATMRLSRAGLHVDLYNHQLCLTDRRLWSFARRSISDWKNDYLPECAVCSVVDECGGLFHSAKHRRSTHIRPILISAGPAETSCDSAYSVHAED